MLLPGIATPSCSSSPLSFQSTIFLSRAVNTRLHMQRFRHCSYDFGSTVVFFLRVFSGHDFLLAHYNNRRRFVGACLRHTVVAQQRLIVQSYFIAYFYIGSVENARHIRIEIAYRSVDWWLHRVSQRLQQSRVDQRHLPHVRHSGE